MQVISILYITQCKETHSLISFATTPFGDRDMLYRFKLILKHQRKVKTSRTSNKNKNPFLIL